MSFYRPSLITITHSNEYLHIKIIYDIPYRNKVSLEFKFRYYVSGKFTKFKFRFLQPKFTIINLANLSQVAKFNSVFIFILLGIIDVIMYHGGM